MDPQDSQITTIKNWLGTGSINIFGLPLSGKDTVGIKLAEALHGKFLSSGMILRYYSESDHKLNTQLNSGTLTPTDQFYDLVLPYFAREDLAQYPLILSSIGRWNDEAQTVMDSAKSTGHEIKAALLLNVSEAVVTARLEHSRALQDRTNRADDKDHQALQTRINEFHTKTMPVVRIYKDLNLLITVNADQSREAVFNETIQKLAAFAIRN